MLTFYGSGTKGPIPKDRGTTLPDNVTWIDARDPSADDMAFLSAVTRVGVPTRKDLEEIETSSRLSIDGDTLIMSLPAMIKDEIGYPASTSVGFVLARDRLVTIRFAGLSSFAALEQHLSEKGDLPPGGMGATIALLEIMVDHLADVLEGVGTDLDRMSREIFVSGQRSPGERRPQRANEHLRHTLQAVGRNGDIVSRVSESLLAISRIAPFLMGKGASLLAGDFKARLETITQDARSLGEFQGHLTNKTQFLLDTLLGLANIEQNNVFRVLTVVSVIGIPPTFIASMYGMNFKNIPEYDWAHGYAYGLTLIACSAILPAAWFKFKGWW